MINLEDDSLNWLLSGDIAIQYQVKRDLLETPQKALNALQKKIPIQGFCKEFLDKRDPQTGLWANAIYQPKWISTHYTLLDLKNFCIPQTNREYVESSKLLLENLWFNKGLVAKERYQDMCITGMLLIICCYARLKSPKINEMIDYIIQHPTIDGGWNCRWQREKSSIGSVHTIISVLEGLREYQANGYTYAMDTIQQLSKNAHELLLKRNLFKSLSTGEVIDKRMVMLSYPCRWKYDILRCLDYFQSMDIPYDKRMQEAIDIIVDKKRKDGTWPVQQKYSGKVHFNMEKMGGPSRWNTLRVLRVLKRYLKS